MKYAILTAIALFCLSAFADGDKTAQGGNSGPIDSTDSISAKERPAFKAANFFQPLRDGFERDPKWPERLTLDTKNISALALRQELTKHPWRVLFHCDRQPIELAKLKQLPDGVNNPGLQFSFGKDDVMARKTFRFKDAKPDRDNDLRFSKFEDKYFVVSLGKNQFRVTHKDIDPQIFSVFHVKETDDLVIEVANENPKPGDVQRLKICPNGEPAKELYISSEDFKD